MKQKIRIGLLAAIIAGSSPATYAIKAFPEVITMSQPDGMTVKVRIIGDESSRYYLTEDGYALSRNDADELVYITLDAKGELVSSDIVYRDPSEDFAHTAMTYEKDMVVRALQERSEQSAGIGQVQFRAPGPGLYTDDPYPSIGAPKSLILLVEYKDVKFTVEDPNDFYTRMLNEKDFSDYGATGSALDWFSDNSSGKFTPEFDVYGPVPLPKNMMWYGANMNQGFDAHPEEMVIHGLELLDDEVDFSQYDCNEDGLIDNVFVIYAGYGENEGASTMTVWPHSSDILQLRPDEEFVFDGVKVNHYACASEQSKHYGRPCGIGLFIHEFSHVLGLPDLYPTNGGSGIYTPGAFSALDSGPYNNEYRTPPNYGMFERYALGWVEPKSFNASGDITLSPIKANDGYIVTTNDPEEFYLFENRQLESYDAFIPNHGMLVWHIDYDRGRWERNTVNNEATHQLVDLVEADGMANRYTPEGDPFPGEENVTSFTPQTNPSFVDWHGRDLGISITDIREDGEGNVCFHVEKNGSGIDGITMQLQSFGISGDVLNAYTDVKVYNLQGILVRTLCKDETTQLKEGVYLVSDAERTIKVRIQ